MTFLSRMHSLLVYVSYYPSTRNNKTLVPWTSSLAIQFVNSSSSSSFSPPPPQMFELTQLTRSPSHLSNRTTTLLVASSPKLDSSLSDMWLNHRGLSACVSGINTFAFKSMSLVASLANRACPLKSPNLTNAFWMPLPLRGSMRI